MRCQAFGLAVTLLSAFSGGCGRGGTSNPATPVRSPSTQSPMADDVASGQPATPESQAFQASIACLREYATSLKGLTVDEARKRLADGKISEEEWKSRGFGGKALVATFPDHEVRVMFAARREALTAVVSIPSK